MPSTLKKEKDTLKQESSAHAAETNNFVPPVSSLKGKKL